MLFTLGMAWMPAYAQTDNLLGLEVTYRCVGLLRYEVAVTAYRDCSAPPLTSSSFFDGQFGFTGTGTNCLPPAAETAWLPDNTNGTQVAVACAGQATTCSNAGAAVKGAQRFTFRRIYRFTNLNCIDYRLTVAGISRVVSLSNAAVAPATPIVLTGQTIRAVSGFCNESPVFSTPGYVTGCVGQPVTLAVGATDPDGDSLVYRLGNCLVGVQAGVPQSLAYAPGLSGTNPVNGTGLQFNAQTGTLTVTPTTTQEAAICVYIDEYRNGQLLNTSIRDFTLQVLDCASNVPPVISGLNGVPGAISDALCTGGTRVYTLTVTDPDPAQQLAVTWNQGLPGASFSVGPPTPAPNGGVQREVTLTFSPQSGDGGLYLFTISATDNACPLVGSTSQSFLVRVRETELSVGDFVSQACSTVTFDADVQFGVPPYTFLWEGPGGVSTNPANTQSNFTHTYTTLQPSYTYTLTVTDQSGCFVTKTRTFNLVQPSVDTNLSISQTTLCETETVTFNYFGLTPSPDITFSFGQFAVPASATGPGPHVVKYNVSGTKTVTMTVSKNGCTQTRTEIIEVTPAPKVSAGPDIFLCKGQGQMIQGSSNVPIPNCNITWIPTDFLVNVNSLTPMANPPSDMMYILQVNCGGGCVSNLDTVWVKVSPNPQVFVNPANEEVRYCLGQAPPTLQAQVPPGQTTTIFNWQPVQGLSNSTIANPTAAPSQTTLYTVTTTNEFGCQSNPAFVLVTVNDVPVANAGPDKFRCPGDPGVVLEGSGTYTSFGSLDYEWQPAYNLSNPFVAQPVATPDTTTTYVLIVKVQETGCSSQTATLDTLQTVTVYVGNPPTGLAGPDRQICLGDSVVLGELPQGGGSLYVYEWIPAAGLSNPSAARPKASPAFSTTYKLWVSSNGCRSLADSVRVTVLPFPTVNVDNVKETCPGQPVQLTTQTFNTGGAVGPFTYRWEPTVALSDPSADQPLASPTQPTTYSLFVSTPGCPERFIESVLVQMRPVPVLDADPIEDPTQKLICGSDSFVIPAVIQSALPFTVSWSPGGSLSDSTVIQPVARPTETTLYTVTVRQGLCTLTDTFRLYVNPKLPVQITGERTTLCLGQSLVLTGSGGLGSGTFTWSEPSLGSALGTGTAYIFTPTDTGSYVFSFTVSEAGCTAKATYAVQVFLTPEPAFRFTYPDGCTGLTVSFEDLSRNLDQRIWDFGDGSLTVNEPNPQHTYTQAGTYTVRLYTTEGQGCGLLNEARTQVVVNPPLVPDFSSVPPDTEPIILGNGPVQFAEQTPGGVSYTWFWDDGATATGTNPQYSWAAEGTYVVTLVIADAAGCQYQTQKTYRVVPPLLNIPNVFTPNGDGVNDTWAIRYDGLQTGEIQVYDRWGIRVFTTQSLTDTWDGRNASAAELPAGVYQYTVKVGERRYSGHVTLIR
jgi:gliding motility-associated-like protein